jgi:hypothetical protein
MEAYLGRLEVWLRENVSKSTAVLSVKAAKRIQKHKPVQFLKDPIKFVETLRCVRETLDAQLAWSAHVNQVGKKAAQRLGVLGPLPNRRSCLSIRNGVRLYKHLTCRMKD